MPREADRIREVFVSATVKDLLIYRTEVADALSGVPAGVYLQEEWSGAAGDVVALSYAKLVDCDAYLGLFGFRYGWIPDSHVKSITELECDKALEFWGAKAWNPPPIFWFVPAPESDIAPELLKAAHAALEKDYPDDPTKRAESLRRQKEFLERLSRSGRFIRTFSSMRMLREKAITSVQNWSIDIIRAAAERRRSAVLQIPPAELGAIGRRTQRAAIEAAILAVNESDSPALCLAIHGNEDAGQFVFMAFLEQWNPWEISGKPHVITPSHERFDVPSLTAAALAEVAGAGASQTATIELVAEAIGDRCRTEPVVMFLHIDRLSGGLDTFRTAFWLPLLEASRHLPITIPRRHPFVLVLVLPTPVVAPLPLGLVESQPVSSADYSNVVLLPALSTITSRDVSAWLEQQGVALKARTEIAARVTGDGVPRGVYDRLNSDGFWNALPQ